MNELVTWFQKEYPDLVESMQKCSHHGPSGINPYHEEGDIWTHTMMVCKQVENYGELTKISALLHDIGKPMCREINKKGYASFYNHDQVSAFMSLEITKKLDLSERERYAIFKAIATHTQIFKLSQIKRDQLFTNEPKIYDLFNYLGKADHEGRFTSIEDDFSIDPTYLHRSDREVQGEAVFLIGVPGAGKTTYRKNYPDYEIVSWDDTLIEHTKGKDYIEKFKNRDDSKLKKVMHEKKMKIIKERKNVIFDLTNMSKKTRNRNLSLLPACYKKTAVLLLPDLPTIWERNEARRVEGKYIEPSVHWRMMKAFYPPSYHEFDEIKVVI